MAASRRILLIPKAISAGKPLDPPAFNYDDLIGKIWIEGGVSGYDHWWDIEVAEPTGMQGGYYDNRE